jgi:hypothetical protein
MSQTTPFQEASPISDRALSLDEAPQLVGKIGIARFEVNENESAIKGQSNRSSPRSLKAALDTAAQNRRSGGQSTPDSTSEEDYDKLQHDPLTVIAGDEGGGYGHIQHSGAYRSGINQELETEQPTSKRDQQMSSELKSIPITLKKADQNGQYYLVAHDLELGEILKIGVERV